MTSETKVDTKANETPVLLGYNERQRDIEALLQAERKVLVEQLSLRYSVSEVTIRKDLTQLENRGVLLRTHGGAVLAEKPELVVPLHRRSQEQIVPKNLIADRAFMGASGFDAKAGFSCQNLIEAETKRAMLQSAQEVVMLVDCSKFTQAAFARFCSLKEVDLVITDAEPPEITREAMR